MPPFSERTNPGLGTPPPPYPGAFLLALRAAFTNLGWVPRSWLGLAVRVHDDLGHEHVLGLENLYRRLRKEPRSRWTERLAEILRDVPSDAATHVIESLADVAGRIFPRLGPVPPPPKDGATYFYHPLVGDRLGITLVVDFPNSMVYVSDELIRESGRTGNEWLVTARSNLLTLSPEGTFKETNPELGLLQSVVADAYDSSRALLLDELFPGHSEHGFFVILPGRDHLLILPARQQTVQDVPWLKSLAVKTFADVAYPLCDDVYWVRAGAWHPFEFVHQEDKILVLPPPEFVDLLNQWTPPPGEDNHDSAQVPG